MREHGIFLAGDLVIIKKHVQGDGDVGTVLMEWSEWKREVWSSSSLLAVLFQEGVRRIHFSNISLIQEALP
jgi:hypothetical protein